MLGSKERYKEGYAGRKSYAGTYVSVMQYPHFVVNREVGNMEVEKIKTRK